MPELDEYPFNWFEVRARGTYEGLSFLVQVNASPLICHDGTIHQLADYLLLLGKEVCQMARKARRPSNLSLPTRRVIVDEPVPQQEAHGMIIVHIEGAGYWERPIYGREIQRIIAEEVKPDLTAHLQGIIHHHMQPAGSGWESTFG